MTQTSLSDLLKRVKLGDSEQLHALVDELPDQIYIKDAEGRYVFNNINHAKALGASSPEEVVGKTDFDFYPQELAERYSVDEQEVISSGRSLVDEEESRVGEQGNRKWFSATKVPLSDGSGEVVGLFSVVRDITQRKEAEEALKENEDNLAELQRIAHLGSWEWNAKTGEVYWSDETYRIYGHEPGAFVPTVDKLMEVVHPDDRELVGKNIHAAFQKDKPYAFEHHIVRPNGEKRFVYRQAKVYFDDEGEPQRMVGTVQDITKRKQAEEALRESEERYRAVVEESVESIFLFDASTRRVLTANIAFQELIGYASEDLLEMTIYDFLAHEREEVDSNVRRDLQERRRFAGEQKYRRKDGSLLEVETSMTVIPYQGREAICAVARDLSERKRAEEALRESEERYRAVVERTTDGIFLGGFSTSRILESNIALQNMLGYTSEELCGMSLYDLIAENRESIDHYTQRIQKSESFFVGEQRYRCKDGSLANVEVSATRIPYGDKEAWCCIVRDITERKALEEQLKHQAFHDSLTGLPNRALFLDRLQHAIVRAPRESGLVAVLFMDLDNFKFVNDTLGHHVGDELLVAVSDRLLTCRRPGDTVARLGGDEFAILLEEAVSRSDAMRVAERIREELQVPFTLEGRDVFVTCSIGVAFADSCQDWSEELIRNAAVAMHRAKEEGKACYQAFDQSMDAQMKGRLRLENDLRRALKREEFVVHYQPVVRLESEQILGMEALVRWEHPERGLVAPDEFVPLAEELGLIVPIGRWVLREACRQAKEWQERYPADLPLRISVNLSARELQHPTLVGVVEEALREARLDPQSLTLEITESAVVKDEEHNIDALRRLGALGIRFALDDFGTGYSALAYLRRLPVDLLKLDRSFVERLAEDAEAEVLLSGVISIASGLGLYVLAEGVETPEQLARVRSLGCELAQGYYFSKPLSSEAAMELLETYNPSASAGSS